MKRKRFILAVILLLIIFSSILYGYYSKTKIQYYLDFFTRDSTKVFANIGLEGDMQLQRIVKKSPKEIVMLVKWGEDEVYINIENWFTKTGDKIQISAFDKEKRVKILE